MRLLNPRRLLRRGIKCSFSVWQMGLDLAISGRRWLFWITNTAHPETNVCAVKFCLTWVGFLWRSVSPIW